jgi:transcriptional regulator with XRE-family HTH domain
MTQPARVPRADHAGPSFGDLLRVLREATVIRGPRVLHGSRFTQQSHLSQNELAQRAGMNAAHVNRLERGIANPSDAIAARLAEALALGPFARARLLAAAGYWPWPGLDPDVLEFVLAAGLAIVEGDWRPLDMAETAEDGR